MWNGRPELFHSPASSAANPSKLGTGIKLALHQQMAPGSPFCFLSPVCHSPWLRGKEGGHSPPPQQDQPRLVSLPAHTISVGAALPLPVSTSCCSVPLPVPPTALACWPWCMRVLFQRTCPQTLGKRETNSNNNKKPHNPLPLPDYAARERELSVGEPGWPQSPAPPAHRRSHQAREGRRRLFGDAAQS